MGDEGKRQIREIREPYVLPSKLLRTKTYMFGVDGGILPFASVEDVVDRCSVVVNNGHYQITYANDWS
jgi:hypothetical protein